MIKTKSDDTCNYPRPPSASIDTLCPQVIDGIKSWILFEKPGGNQYVVGSLEVDRYISVPSNRLDTTTALIRLFDGEHSLGEMRNFARENLRQDADVEHLYTILSEAGLVVAPSPTRVVQGEFKQLSIQLFEIHLAGLARLRPIANSVFAPAAWISVLLIIAGLASAPNDLLSGPSSFQISSSYLLGILFLNLAMMGASLLHELAHCLVAIKLGLTPRKLAAALYLGIMLFFYVEIAGIYTLKPRDRIKIWLAGSWMNLTIAGAILLIRRLVFVSDFADEFLLKIALANLLMIVGNLTPLMPTDGYFIMCTLLKVWNVRTSAWQMFKTLVVQRQSPRHGWAMWIYFILAMGLLLRAMAFQIQWILGIITEGISRTDSAVGRMLVVASPLILIIVLRLFSSHMKGILQRRATTGIDLSSSR